MTTFPEDIVTQLVSGIKEQATKGPEAIEATVQAGHDQLIRVLDATSEERARFKPSSEAWSVLEVLQHVVTAKRRVAHLCTTLAHGETPEAAGGEGGLASRQDGITHVHFATLAEARSATQAAHEELIDFIKGLSPTADTTTTFKHYLFGALNCREWAAFQRVHDGDHTRQIEAIQAAPGYSSA